MLYQETMSSETVPEHLGKFRCRPEFLNVFQELRDMKGPLENNRHQKIHFS